MYKLYPDCIPVKGFSRSVIFNLFHNEYIYIPNDLYNLLNKYENTTEWYKHIEKSKHLILDEYIKHLVDEKCLYHVNDLSSGLVSLEYTWDTPEDVSILNIETTHNVSYKELDLVNYLKKTRVQNLVINSVSLAISEKILSLLQETYVLDVNLYLPYCHQNALQFDHLIEKYPFITKIVLTGAKDNTSCPLDSSNQVIVHYLKEYKTDPANRSISFVINKKFFLEARSFNSFYNKRLFIDTNGNIKDCYSGPVLSNIKTCSLTEHKISGKYWSVKKDSVETCKDCEHRYMCYDPRIPIKTGEKTIYATHCGYDPYKVEWIGNK
ncbi:MAG: hypothetical protein LBR65_04565 [Culturomica sp.]|jgi:SPASM domain peptide maturase of grasp-with-spasm system|nr:hypothetical protein [Culturomica sp.]